MSSGGRTLRSCNANLPTIACSNAGRNLRRAGGGAAPNNRNTRYRKQARRRQGAARTVTRAIRRAGTRRAGTRRPGTRRPGTRSQAQAVGTQTGRGATETRGNAGGATRRSTRERRAPQKMNL